MLKAACDQHMVEGLPFAVGFSAILVSLATIRSSPVYSVTCIVATVAYQVTSSNT
jgi:hypothetical protein